MSDFSRLIVADLGGSYYLEMVDRLAGLNLLLDYSSRLVIDSSDSGMF